MGDIGTAIRRGRAWQSQTAVRAYALARSVADRLGVQIVLKTYYSPIPDWTRLPAEVWTQRDPMRGIRFDLDAQLALLQAELSPLLKAFAPDEQIGAQYRYTLGNPSYPIADARLLFAMVRWLKPRSVIELGSGQTSRVISHACRLNAAEGQASTFRVFDPFPTAIDDGLPGLTELVRVGTQDVPEDIFAGLGSGDVLIVDTTHTVKLGSEVNRIILRLLPLLASGVYVHFHDICLPYEYPRYLYEEYALYWAEQYLLQAFLSMNPSFEVICAVHALCRDRADAVSEVGLGYHGETGGAFWIRPGASP